MKSGTNWICRLLNLHPEVHCIGEFHWQTFFHAAEVNVNRIAPRRQAQLKATLDRQLPKMVRHSLVELSGQTSGIIGDRTPTTIDPVILRVPHIVMIRDFRDVIVSRMYHLYNNPRVTGIFDRLPKMAQRLVQFQADPWHFHKQADDLLDCEEIVRDSGIEWTEHLRRDRETVAYDDDLPVLFVRYEDLHRDFASKLNEVFGFLELAIPTQIPDLLTPGHCEEIPTQLNRKGAVGDWENYANQEQLSWIHESAGDEMRAWGYLSGH